MRAQARRRETTWPRRAGAATKLRAGLGRIALLALALWGAPAAAQVDACTTVANGATQEITAFGICRKVTNATGLSLCAVTGVSAENWTNFYGGPPSGVTIAACAGATCSYWGGTLNGGQSSNAPSRFTRGVAYTQCGEDCANFRVTAECSAGGTLSCHDALGGVTPCTGLQSACSQNSTCFTPETPITMADGSTKPVSALRVGDAVRGRTRINRVLGLPTPMVDQPLYALNRGRAFVTGGHPFMTGEGWKAVDPSLAPSEGHTGIHIGKLEIGDELVAADGSRVRLETIEVEHRGPMTVYNPVMDGDHTYFANGYLVHNKVCE